MPVTGRKPKANPRNRNQPTYDWVEIADVPFPAGPKLPARGGKVRLHSHTDRRIRCDEGCTTVTRTWPSQTRRWWRTVSAMPHCTMWTESDWQYAVDTAELHARFTEGENDGAQLRLREAVLGTTADARRDLRIRYLAPSKPDPDEPEPPPVSQLDDYRTLYGA